jgi:transmembrane sensor
MSMSNPESGPHGEQADWDALARYLAGESTAEEAERMRLWLDARPERAQLVAAMRRAIEPLAGSAADVDVEAALRTVHARIDAESKAAPARPALTVASGGAARRPMRWETKAVPVWQRNTLRIAAAAVLVVSAGVLWRSTQPNDHGTPVAAAQRFATAVGQRDTVRLTDGSRIVIGPGTELTVASGFGDRARDVTLNGEAYFDVVHDESRPFTVHAGGATIVDVGTTFTVQSDSSAGVRVAVTSGAVRLRRATGADAGALLQAGDVGMLAAEGPVVAERNAASADDSAFAGGKLVFRDAPLSQVRGALRRWYGVDLVAADSTLARRRLTASFEGEPVERVLSVIGMTLGVDLERNGSTVTVRPPRLR